MQPRRKRPRNYDKPRTITDNLGRLLDAPEEVEDEDQGSGWHMDGTSYQGGQGSRQYMGAPMVPSYPTGRDRPVPDQNQWSDPPSRSSQQYMSVPIVSSYPVSSEWPPFDQNRWLDDGSSGRYHMAAHSDSPHQGQSNIRQNTYNPDHIRRGMEIAQRVWMRVPQRPSIQYVSRRPEPGESVITTGPPVVVRRPISESRVPLPPTPQPAAEGLPSQRTNEPSLQPSATTQPEANVSAHGGPESGRNAPFNVDPTRDLQKQIDAAKAEVLRKIVQEEAIPSSDGKANFMNGVFEKVSLPLNQRRKIETDLSALMASVRRLFKDYARCRVQREFGLRLNLGSSEIEHKKERVHTLLQDLAYIKQQKSATNPESMEVVDVFTTPLFEDLVIDTLFLFDHHNIHQYVQDNNLDNIFGLAGAGIAAALRQFREGYFVEQPASADSWRDSYVEIEDKIKGMRSTDESDAWISQLQRDMLAKGRSLRRGTT